MAETREEARARRLEELRQAREEKAAQMAAERLTTRTAAIEKTAVEQAGGVLTVKPGATTQERVKALGQIRAAEDLASYSAAPEFKAIPFGQLDPGTRGVINANAAAAGMSPEEYYKSRGGINQSGYYGDSYTPGLTLSEREYQIARLEGGPGTTGAGAAINLASAKKAYDFYTAQGDNPVKASIRSGYTGTPFQVKAGIGRDGGNIYLFNGKYYDDAGNEISESVGKSTWNNSSVVATSANVGSTQQTFISTSSTTQPIVSNMSTGSTTGTGTGVGLAKDTFKNTLALFFGATEAAKPWADALYGVVSKYFRSGSDANESFNLALQEARTNPALKPFADRFKGIFALQDMRQQGKPVLVPTIGEYVASQAGMSNLLTQAGLGNLATEEFTGDLIGKGNSVSTIADKINKAFTRIDLAPKAIKDTLSRFYPTVDRPTLARTILLGAKGVEELVDELAQYEVLAAAEQQGLGSIQRAGGVDLARAQEYARSGQTFSSLLPKFGQISRAMPEVSRLAGISRREDIGQAGIEKAVISQSAKELAELEKISLEEEARFKTRAGRAELGLASQRRANRAF